MQGRGRELQSPYGRYDYEEEESSEGACSAECNSATKSVFTGCDANDSTEASLKTKVRDWVFKNGAFKNEGLVRPRNTLGQDKLMFFSSTGSCLRDAADFGPINAGTEID